MNVSSNYSFVRTIGAGTWGTVFEAKASNGLTVAVKKLFGKDALRSGVDFSALRESILLSTLL